LPSQPSILVVHDRPEECREVLAARYPGRAIAYAGSPAEVVPALAAHRPEVVLAIKHSGFPGAAQRPIVDFPTVRWVQVGGSGYDHFLPWDPARVTLTNCAGVLAQFLAETVLGAIIVLNRGFLSYRDQQRRREWTPIAFQPLRDRTLLIVGAGAIGGALGRLAKGLGMRVIGVRRAAGPMAGFDEVIPPSALVSALPRADIVSLHLRVTPETRGLFDRAAFTAMKPGATFINTARGALVDEAALIEALAGGRIAAAYLDVFAVEPLPASSPLWAMDNVFITPHASDNVGDWVQRFTAVFADNLDRWLRGEPLQRVVTP
jgi:phosphoglycerate dehydrogenase-like enzyme